MRTCPFCIAAIDEDFFACRRHWALLSQTEKNDIHAAYRMYSSRLLGLDKLRERQAKVIAAVKSRQKEWAEATGIEDRPEKPKQELSRCRTCKATIFWATTEQGKTIPMDADPVVDGNMYRDGDTMRAVSLLNQPEEGTPLFKSHFATCSEPASHRKVVRK